MKTKVLLLLSAIAFAFASCNNKAPEAIELENTCAYPLEMEKYTFSDSSKYAMIDIYISIPVAKDSISQIIRDTLMGVIADRLQNCQNVEDKPLIARYSGDDKDAKSMFDYYSKAIYKIVKSGGEEDFYNRVEMWEEDTTLTETEVEEKKNLVFPFNYEMNVTKTFEDSTYVVFYAQEYEFSGGVHGGVFGLGGLTFRFADGSKVNGFLKDNVTKAMQPLLKKGLKEYFSEMEESPVKTDRQLRDNLLLDSNEDIPLPVWMPYPDEKGKGLSFVYQQYEIASYADGMPSFVLTWDELKPFLKEDILEEMKLSE